MTLDEKIKRINNTITMYERRISTCKDGEECRAGTCLSCFSNRCSDVIDENKQMLEWLTDYQAKLRKEEEFRPTMLYAIEHCPTGKIIFNARGGCYKHPDEAKTKLEKLGEESYRIVTYKLSNEGA